MKRRSFVKNVSLASVSVPLVFNDLQIEAISKNLFSVPKVLEERVLVIIRLNGGNDGLNTIVPLAAYDNLMIQRPNIILPENDLIPIAGDNGLHPVMTGMANLHNDGYLSIIQNVGYPEQNRSHFRSMDIWTNGSKDIDETTGWLGRHFTYDHPDYPDGYPNNDFEDPFAISMGFEVSATCQGLLSNFSHSVTNPFDASNIPNNSATNDGTYYGEHMEYLSAIIQQTNQFGSQITAAANAGNTFSTLYDPNSNLAQQLRYVAQMISGGLKTKVYILNINGFDTHDSQVLQNDTTQGIHAGLMKDLSDAIHAFQDDLIQLGLEKRVLGMTFSEFGRQIASNASIGTDHGDAAPLFLFGECVSTVLYGPNPVVTDQIVPQAGLPMQIDFRDVYASILQQWFGVENSRIEDMFEHQVTYHSLIEGCNLNTNDLSAVQNVTMVYPNPCSDKTTLKFTAKGGKHNISIHDLSGRKVKEVFEGELSPASHHIPIDLDGLTKGTFIITIRFGDEKESVKLMKID